MVLVVSVRSSEDDLATNSEVNKQRVLGRDCMCVLKPLWSQHGYEDSVSEFQYEQFNSVQGLLDAMCKYQHMAPQKLTDTVSESILWNKVPVKLQKQLKEIIDGSMQELLQKL